MDKYQWARIVATTLLETTKKLKRKGKNIENISDKDYKDIFILLKLGYISKEGIEMLMEEKADNPDLTILELRRKWEK